MAGTAAGNRRGRRPGDDIGKAGIGKDFGSLADNHFVGTVDLGGEPGDGVA